MEDDDVLEVVEIVEEEALLVLLVIEAVDSGCNVTIDLD